MQPFYSINFSKRRFIFLVSGLTATGLLLFIVGLIVGMGLNTDSRMTAQVAEMPQLEQMEADTSEKWKAFSIQVGAFRNKDNAQRMITNLKTKGYPAHLLTARDQKGQNWYAVRIGSYPDSIKARQVAAQFREQEKMKVIVRPAGEL